MSSVHHAMMGASIVLAVIFAATTVLNLHRMSQPQVRAVSGAMLVETTVCLVAAATFGAVAGGLA